MITRQHYHPNFKFSDIKFQKHPIAHLADHIEAEKLTGELESWLNILKSSERAEIICKNGAVLTISRAEIGIGDDGFLSVINGHKETFTFEVGLIFNEYTWLKSDVDEQSLLKIIARLNNQDNIKYETHKKDNSGREEVESVLLDLSYENFNIETMKSDELDDLLNEKAEDENYGYLIKFKKDAAEEFKLSEIDENGFHLSVYADLDKIKITWKKVDSTELSTLIRSREVFGDLTFKINRKYIYEDVSDFMIQFLDL
ncbi:hypothetical protein [Brucella gallinifaecis]|uniref:hypothetical protein n=1 Tax=Brucella gallinifaecis TaxID=215590 RepID=UPI0023629542|nr:hypothetical protein [Brucella gallinifaecis]